MSMPIIGSIIYVPSMSAKEFSKSWYDREKSGGQALVENIQYVSDNECFIFTREYGLFSINWNDIKDLQEDLKQKYGIYTWASII